MNKFLMLVLAFIMFLTSCTSVKPTAKSAATETPIAPTKKPVSTSTYTPEPTSTATITASPTPMGGKKLRAAYLSFDCASINTQKCIAIADIFNNTVLDRIPLNDATNETELSWSPDGRYLLYQDMTDKQYDFNVMLYDFVLSQSRLLINQPVEMPVRITEIHNNTITYSRPVDDNDLGSGHWSADSKYVTYRTFLDAVSNQTNIFSPETGENKIIYGFGGFYYWLDDQRSLVEIKTGKLYDVETDEITTIPNASFMNVSMEYEDYIVSYKGDYPSKPDKIYLFPYVKDRELLTERGTEMIYDNEFLFAKFDYANKERWPSINLNALFFQGDTVIFSGYTYLYEPFEAHQYVYKGNMADIPFIITTEDFVDLSIYDYSKMISISPDGKLYLTQQVFPLEDKKIRQSIITINDMKTGEELGTFDFHALGEEMHEIDYMNGENLVFYWEE